MPLQAKAIATQGMIMALTCERRKSGQGSRAFARLPMGYAVKNYSPVYAE